MNVHEWPSTDVWHALSNCSHDYHNTLRKGAAYMQIDHPNRPFCQETHGNKYMVHDSGSALF